MPRTSNKAEKIVEFVNAFIAENGYSPSVREIGEAVGLRSTASVSYHLQALQEKGVFQAPAGPPSPGRACDPWPPGPEIRPFPAKPGDGN